MRIDAALLALFLKMIDERLENRPLVPGPRGQRGRSGIDGKNFNFSEHEDKIRSWAKEFALKFDDFSEEQIALLRGARGAEGRPGRDGASINFADHEATIKSWVREFALKFDDLDEEQIKALRGPRGRDGKDGEDGTGFEWEAEADKISEIIGLEIEKISEKLKLRFNDLNSDDIERIRGPRGRDGRDGRDFIFDEHLEYFDSLKLKFSDLSEPERDSLKMRFSNLTEEERASLRLRFEDLTEENKSALRGPRGARGQRGSAGRDGEDGKTGKSGLSIIGPRGMMGLTGRSGKDGVNGADAPYVADISIDQSDDLIVFIFLFSDGTEIRSDEVKLPASIINNYGGGTVGRGKGAMEFDTIVDEASSTITYVGKANPGSTTAQAVWKIQRIQIVGTETIILYADSDFRFDNVWDNRASLAYG